MKAAEIEAWCIQRFSEILEMPEESIDTNRELDNLGLDSASKIALGVELEEFLGRRLAPDVMAGQPTIRDLARTLADEGT